MFNSFITFFTELAFDIIDQNFLGGYSEQNLILKGSCGSLYDDKVVILIEFCPFRFTDLFSNSVHFFYMPTCCLVFVATDFVINIG